MTVSKRTQRDTTVCIISATLLITILLLVSCFRNGYTVVTRNLGLTRYGHKVIILNDHFMTSHDEKEKEETEKKSYLFIYLSSLL